MFLMLSKGPRKQNRTKTKRYRAKLKAKNRGTNAPLEVGYNSALPCVLALEAMQQNRVLGWDATARKSKAL